jgi:hypothetical protein
MIFAEAFIKKYCKDEETEEHCLIGKIAYVIPIETCTLPCSLLYAW